MNRISCLFLSLLLVSLLPDSVRPQISVIGELSQDKEARTGETYEGVILVKNDSNAPQEVKVYQTDYLFFSNGVNNYGEPGSHPRSNAAWVTFSPSFLTVPPQATIPINYIVQVPKDSGARKLTGTYWSMMMIEGIPKGSPESSGARRAEMGITQTIRYGIQIATHVAKTGTRKIDVKDAKIVTKEDGARAFQFDLENTGDIGLRPDVTLELFNDKGASIGTFPGVRYRTYPGTSVRQSIDVTKVPRGTYKALVIVDAGADEISAWEYPVKF